MPEPDAPLVCLHGFLGCGEDFDALRERLPERWVLAPNLPGHGLPPAPLPERDADFADAVASVGARLRSLGLSRCHLLGYSMGGRVALGLTVWHPELVASAIAIGAHPGIEDPAARAERAQLDAGRAAELRRAGLDAFLEGWYRQELFAALRERPDFESVLARRRRAEAGALADALVSLGTGRQPPLAGALAQTTAPTLLVAGERDTKYRSLNERLAARGDSLRARVVPGCGHAVHIEAPDALAAIIEQHLASA